MRYFFSLLFLIFGLNTTLSQNILIKGKILNSNRTPIDMATIYLNHAKDSTLINYTISEANGSFNLPLNNQNSPTILIISAEGYTDYVKTFEVITSDIQLEPIILEKSSKNTLDEIVIKANVAPVKIKKDTLEFNANSFKVREDATVKSLLEQLPGVVVGDDGKIRVNGKEVNNILINGKPFFDESGKVILNNLPANMIDKVQITDYKTNEQKQSNEASTSDQQTINLTVKEDKNKGFFGNITGGYGSNDRYESSLLLNYFNKDRKISVLASSNNINSIGFSNGEIFDNMASARNNSFSYGNDGTLGINGVTLGGGKGIFSTNMVGINYSETFNKKHFLGSNYIFNQVDYKNTNRSRTENLLPDQRVITESESNQNQISTNHNAAVQTEIKLDKNLTLNIAPKISFSNVDFHSKGLSETKNMNNTVLNDQAYNNTVETNQKNISNDLSLVKAFKKKNRNLIASFNVSFKDSDVNEINISQNNFYETNTTDNRNQKLNTNTKQNKLNTEIRYKEPIGVNKELTVGFKYGYVKDIWDRNALNYNTLTNFYSIQNESLTFQNELNVNVFSPTFSFKQNFKKGYLLFKTQSNITDYTLNSSFLNQKYQQNKVDVLPNVNVTANIPVTKQGNLYLTYSYDEEINSLKQLAPVEDLSNPLFTSLGNPNLKNTQTHFVGGNYYSYNPEKKLGFYAYFGSTINTIGVINNFYYDASFKGNLTYKSANAGSNSYFGIGSYKSYKFKDNQTFVLQGDITTNYNIGYGITNNQKFSSYNLSYTPNIGLSYKIKDVLEVSTSYTLALNKVNYKNYVIDNTNFSQHSATLLTTIYWPKNVVFGNDVTYTYNTNISDGFKKDFFLWNTSLGYKFYKEKFTAKVKVYDLLNQNQNVRRVATETQISDNYNTILKRYVMFSLTYKFNKFGVKPQSRFTHDFDD